MKPVQRTRLHLALGLIAAAFAGSAALAQTPGPDVLSIIAPYPAGGASDVVARTLQPAMAKVLGKTMIVDNVSGVAGALGSQKMLSSGAAGQSMLVGSPNEVILAPMALKAVKYKPQDFKLVTHLATAPVVLFTRPDFPANNVEELVKLAKAPGAKPITYATSGKGSLYHLVAESVAGRLGPNMTHVPYRGGAPAMQDVAGSAVDISFAPMIPQYLQLVEAGRLKVIGVAAASRSPALPKVQAFGEVPALKDLSFDAWVGIFVPAASSADSAARIGKAAYEAAATPEFQRVLQQSGNAAGHLFTPEQAAAFYKSETERYEQIARSIKLEAD
jgi:tripartite-type tricarboxylate transporter receptor subunit TctC